MMSAVNGEKALVTGATGLLGSHIAERLTATGCRSARWCASSRTDFLDTIGVEIVRGDLTDPAACAAAVAGVALVFHCAAKVGDWGKWSEFQTVAYCDTNSGRGRRSSASQPLHSYQLDERVWPSGR